MQTSNKCTTWTCALKLLGELALVFLLGVLVVGIITLSTLGGKSGFEDTYQSAIQRKYEKLKSIEGPKIVILGGSNAGFGFDSVLLEEETGYPVANMGLHAGFGTLFNTEIAKRYIGQGDIVILAYEYRVGSKEFENLGDVNLIMTGIDNKLEMYRELPLKSLPVILGNLLPYLQEKVHRPHTDTGAYSSASFDEFGHMILKRERFVIDYDNNVEKYGTVRGKNLSKPNDQLVYLKEYKKYVEGKGASVYFTAPVLLDKAYKGTAQDLLNYAHEIETITGIPFISDPNDYLFSSDDMFDTVYHCNEKGAKRRTELFLNDLREYGIVD